MSFSELGLSEPLLRAVSELGYDTPTPIQRQAIPVVLEGGDLLAGAQTGTGKTAGFTLPLLQRLSASAGQPNGRRHIRALILTPTRELAAQVEESVREYGKYVPLRSMMMFGGVGVQPQVEQLKRGVDILVATPGRLLDHMQQGNADLSHVEILVLDEADRMLDMGFIRDIKKILAKLPSARQNLLFSATFSDEIKTLASGLLNAPKTIEVARRNATAQSVAQKIHMVDRERKRELLAHLISTNDWAQVLVFTRTKHGANRLAEQLNKDGITAMAIHGNKSQSARTRALAEFKDASLRVLVATDIAARGIDIDQLPHVVNFDLPNVPEDYVHRIGRTGRAGATGEALSLVCIDELELLADIEKVIKRELPREAVAGFTPDPSIKAEPIQKRSGGGGGRGQPHDGQSAGGRSQAGAGRGQPGAGRAQPGAGRAQAGAGRAQPGAGRAQPGAGRSQSGAGRSQPAGAASAVSGNGARAEVDGNVRKPAPPRAAVENRPRGGPAGGAKAATSRPANANGGQRATNAPAAAQRSGGAGRRSGASSGTGAAPRGEANGNVALPEGRRDAPHHAARDDAQPKRPRAFAALLGNIIGAAKPQRSGNK